MLKSLLSESDIETFERDGVVVLRGVLDPNFVDGLRHAVDAQIQGAARSPNGYDLESIARALWSGAQPDEGSAARLDLTVLAGAILSDPDARPLLETDASNVEGMFLFDAAIWKQNRHVREAAFDSALPRLAAQLLKSETIRFWEDTTFVKAPHTRQKTAFHQDISFTQITGDQCLITWIPLDPANRANGVTRYVRGSHKWDKTFAANMLVSQTAIPGSGLDKVPDIEGHEADYDIIDFDVEPGDIIVHHVKVIHGAGGNTTDRMRRAISFRYVGDDARYYNRPGCIPQANIDTLLPDGARLETSDYPLVWPRPWPEALLARIWESEAGGLKTLRAA